MKDAQLLEDCHQFLAGLATELHDSAMSMTAHIAGQLADRIRIEQTPAMRIAPKATIQSIKAKVAGWPGGDDHIIIPNPAKQPLRTFVALMKPGEFEYTWFDRGAFKPGFPNSRGVGIPYQGTGNLIAREDGALAEIWQPV